MVASIRLTDGTRVLVRPIAPTDKAALADGLARLSLASRNARFLGPKVRFSSAELRYLTEVDGHDHIALVGLLPERPDELVAVARSIRALDDPGAAEVALVVGDCLQGRGLGSAMGRLLADEGRAHGIERVRATMHADNVRARRLLRSMAARLDAARIESGVAEVRGRLAA
jgi:RimJ/RimL family protein N-acetyltransferase